MGIITHRAARERSTDAAQNCVLPLIATVVKKSQQVLAREVRKESSSMPFVTVPDGTRLYYETVGEGDLPGSSHSPLREQVLCPGD
jgi:hypothetical protein